MKNHFHESLIVIIALCLSLFHSTGGLYAQQPRDAAGMKPGVSYVIDWHKKVIRVEIREPIAATGKNLAAASYTVERSIQSRIDSYIMEALSEIPIDSQGTFGSLLAGNVALMERARTLSTNAVKISSNRNENFSMLSVTYSIPFYPEFARVFINHTNPYSPPRLLNYVSSARYTGIVIYAASSFPVHGEPVKSDVKPCLFPSLYDSRMNLILSSKMMNPDLLKSRGMVTYTDGKNQNLIEEIAGTNPLYIIPEKIFGNYRTDLIIPVEEAAKLLSTEANRSLLTSGKIVIICNL